MYKLLLITFILSTTLQASKSENTLKAMIVGKVSKYISWQDNSHDNFVITVLKDPFDGKLKDMYSGKKIKSKNVKVVYIDTIDELGFTNILYIPTSEASELQNILQKIKNKNILTVSDIRGFAEKKGAMQLYFVSQKIKLKINLDISRENDLKIKSSLLRIATVIKEND